MGQTVPPGRASGVALNGPQSDELRPVTSLFADVVGSTALGERLEPAEVKALIGECVSRMCESIESYGGSVRSYMGDGVAGFFGIDAASEEDVERAAYAALNIRDVMRAYADDVQSTWAIPEFNVRIGLNTGTVAVGFVGSTKHPQRVALGDSVNVAARLQAAARPGAIVVGEAVAEALGARFVFQPLGKLAVRGKSAPIVAYELESRGRASTTSSRAAFVGRTAELSVFDAAIRDVAKGRGHACFVVGEAGIGKSRLLQEVRLRASSEILWLEGVADSFEQRLPYEPLVQPIQRWLGVDAATNRTIATRVRLNARGRELMGPAFDDWSPYFARLLGISLETRVDRRLDGLPQDVLMKGLTQSYIDWLRTLAQQRPVVLAIDNFEAASDATVRVVDRLLDDLPTVPILLALAMRTDTRCPATAVRTRALGDLQERSSDIRVRPLRVEDCEALIGALDVNSVLNERLRNLVLERADGNPLYLEQLLRAVSADPRPMARPDALPSALASLLLARIDRLPPQARTLLQCAAVLGRSFAKEVLRTMASADGFEQALTELLRADVVREHGRSPATYQFRHGLVREVALSTLPPHRFKLLNKRAAEALLNWTGFELERDAEPVARHYLASDDLGPAVDCLERLAEKYALISRFDEAAGLFGKCIEEMVAVGDEASIARLVRKQSRAFALTGELDAAIAVLEDALRGLRDRALRRELTLAKATCLVEVGADDEAQECLCELSEEDSDAAADPRTAILVGKLALDRGDLTGAEAASAEVGDIAVLDDEVAFEAASLRAGVLAGRGRLEEAETWALRAGSLADRLGQISLQLTARRHVALICLLKGYPAESYTLMKSVYERCSQLGYTAGLLESALSLLHIAHHVGAFGEAAEIGTNALSAARTPLFEGLVAANLAGIEIIRGRTQTGRELANRALAVEEHLPSWGRIAARVSLAYAALAEDDDDQCERHLLDALDMALSSNWETERLGLATALADLYVERGAYDQARPFVVTAFESRSKVDLRTAMHIERLELVTASLNRDDLVAGLEAIRAQARRSGLKIEEALTLLALARHTVTDPSQYAGEATHQLLACGAPFYLRYVPEPVRTRYSVAF